jgi:hypothetical protein
MGSWTRATQPERLEPVRRVLLARGLPHWYWCLTPCPGVTEVLLNRRQSFAIALAFGPSIGGVEKRGTLIRGGHVAALT